MLFCPTTDKVSGFGHETTLHPSVVRTGLLALTIIIIIIIIIIGEAVLSP
jgi:hypothetical protein